MMDPNPPPPPPRQQPSFTGSETLDMTSANKNAPNDTYTSTNNRGSIAERRAVKFGFNADRINTARFRSITPLTSPATAVRSPCITIPPGISPTALLDSPIMLPNSQLSPTTGSFPFPPMNYGDSVTPADMDKGNNAGDFQEVGSVKPSMEFEFPVEFINAATTESYAQGSINDLSSMVTNANFSDVQMQSVPGENVGRHHPQAEEEKGKFPATGIARNSEDGYNWRKYGQKQVKGSEYPRSYYKCTHQHCQVKKKIERSHDGQITEIIYKGTHNHPKPQPSRRAQQVGSATSSFDGVTEMDECSETGVKVEVGSVWKNSKDGLERTSSASVVTDLSDPLSTTHGKCSGTFESAGTPELSSTLVSNDDDDDGATQGSISLSADADIEESESKRRKVESCLVETSLSSRAVREPRVVVQIESEVDILDDGYRWRKYGQKVVKGNPNPRSYYKCTSAGCTVRKHVERASHNLKFVITTYEGKHNHEVPAAKNSNNLNASGGNLPQVTTNAQPSLTLARNTNRTKPENQLLDYAPGFDRKPVFNNEYSRPNFPGNFGNQMKLGASSIYPLKFHPLQHTMSYSSMEFNYGAANHSGSIASLVPDFQISLPSSLHTSANLSMAGVDFNYNGKPISQGQPFLSGHQLVLPKQEQRDDEHFDASRATIEHVNGSLPSSVYQSIMGNFPS